MNGLEALNDMIETFDCGGYQPASIGCIDGEFKEVFRKELSVIERELKVLELFYDKVISVKYIRSKLWYYKTTKIMPIKEPDMIGWILNEYNNNLTGVTKLTEEEMTLIVEWLKGE